MKKTKSIVTSMGVAFALWLTFGSVQAQDFKTCSISNEEILCAESTADRKAVFDAMSNPKSTRYFINLLERAGFSLDVNRRETYRRSLERNRLAMHRYARAQSRSYRRRKIDDEAYGKIASRYKTAVKTYRAAMNIYRGTIWHSKTPSRYEE